MKKSKQIRKSVNDEPGYKKLAALIIMFSMTVIPWVTYLKVVKLDATASEYFQNSDGLSADFFLYYKAVLVIILGIFIACFIIGENIFPDNIGYAGEKQKQQDNGDCCRNIYCNDCVISSIFTISCNGEKGKSFRI